MLYRDGKGVKQSDTEAYKWFLNAAHKQNADAQCELAKMYEEGRGIEQSYTDAFYWYHHAEQNGSSEAVEGKRRLIKKCKGDIEMLAADLIADMPPEELNSADFSDSDDGIQSGSDDKSISDASSDSNGPSLKDQLDAVNDLLNNITEDAGEAARDNEAISITPSKDESKSTNNCRYDISDSKFQPVNCPNVHFDDIAGLQDLKKEIYETIILPVKRPDLFKLMGLDVSTGILMYGPPGTGKTMMGQAIATEIDAKFFIANGSDIESKFTGESEKNIAELFHSARAFDRSVIFFDEFESLGMSRDIGFNQDVFSGRITQLLKEIQGFDKNDSTIVLLAATNRPWDIDSALLRPGRFGTHIYVGLPDFDAREYIIRKQFENVPIDSDVNLDDIVARTEWFNAADVKNLCDRIKRATISRCIDSETIQVQNCDVQQELEKAKSSVSIDDLERYEAFKNQGS